MGAEYGRAIRYITDTARPTQRVCRTNASYASSLSVP